MSKKLIALVLAFALVFSTITVAFADTAIPADAQAAKDLGMLVGSGNGVTIEYLQETPTRLQAAIMYLRLKGLEETALSYTGTDNFADAEDMMWVQGRNILAYLKAHPELGFIGIGGNKFNGEAKIDAASYYKVMLEALGYKQGEDFQWEDVIEFAAEKGLVKVANVTNFTVNDLATATIEALKATVKGGSKTLVAQLVETGVISEAAAIAAGVYTPVPADLAVESVATDNLKQLVVKFNKEIKAAGDEDNYVLEADNAVIDAASDFALQADKKTVVITLTTKAAQQEVVSLTVKDIEAVDGTKLTKTIVKDIELFDKTIPTAVKAEVVGNDTIKVTFSEPIETIAASDFKVDGGEIIVKNVAPANAERTAFNVELYSTLEEGTVTIEAGTGVKDYAGFAAPKKSFTVNVVEDATAPVVVGYKDAEPDTVTLIFNEDIKFVDDTPDLADFYHTNTSQTASAVSIEGNELTIEFNATNTLPEGTAYIYIEKGVVADLWDNENAKQSYAVKVELDETAPTVTKVEAGDDETILEITFSEKMDVDSTQDEDNYTVLDKDGKVVEGIISSVTLNADKKVATVVFDEDLNGDYSIVIENVKDEAGNKIVKVTKAFNITDVTAPLFSDVKAKLYNAGEKNQMLMVDFKEAMAVTGKYSVLDLEKYQLGTDNLADLEGVTIKAVNGNKSVEIYIPSTADDEDGKNFTADADLVIARVADAAGNYTAELVSDAINVAAEGTVGIDTVELTSKNTVVVTLLDKLTKFVAADFTISNTEGALDIARVRHTTNEDGMSVITFTLADEVATDANDITVATAATTASQNIYGELLADEVTMTAVDKAAPTVEKITYVDETTIVITFSEELKASTFATGKNGFSVTGGGKLTSAAKSTENVKEVILTGEDFTKNTNVYYNSVFGLTDMNNNKLADIAHTDELE